MKDEVGFVSSDTFDVLSNRTRSLRAERDRIEWSSISVEMDGIPFRKNRYTGVADIDQILVGDLTCGEPKAFRVEPGEHTVTVHLRRWLRLPEYPEKAVVALRVAVQPGERVKLVCGLRPEAREEWRRIQDARFRSSFIPLLSFGLGYVLALGFGWFGQPFARNLAALATFQLNIPGAWIPWIYALVGSRVNLMALTLLAWCAVWALLIGLPSRRVRKRLNCRFVDPYYLKKAEEPLHGRQPAV